MLHVSELSVSYGLHRALSRVNLGIEPGEIVVILGANGAGKSTLLGTIAGICEGRVSGEVTLNEKNLLHRKSDQIVEAGVAFVPEGRGIFAELSVWENLMLGAYSRRGQRAKEKNLKWTLDLFPKLLERKHQRVSTMSGGEQQMVAIGRAIMSNPEILMLDEPSLGLSPILCSELFRNLSHIRETGMGVLLVEQNAKQSLAIADRGYLIENGEITSENSASAMLSDAAVQLAFLGGSIAKNEVKGNQGKY